MSTVQLSKPVTRGETEITSVTLREPRAGELRGLKLTDIVQLDVTALITLVPRISDPALTPDEVAGLSPRDFTQLGGAVVGFFAPAGDPTVPDIPTT